MGFTKEEVGIIEQFRIGNSQIQSVRHIPRPLGKKSDGTLYRVFMVDIDLEVLKGLRQMLLPQHFEILGIGRSGSQAYDFFMTHGLAVDLVITDLYLPDCTGYQLIEEMKKINPRVLSVVMVPSKKDIQFVLAERLMINFHITKPVAKVDLFSRLKELLS